MSAPLPADSGRPFDAPWQARVFALAHEMVARGLFTWPEHAEALGAAIARDRAAEAADSESAERDEAYWEHYLEALETVLQRKGLA